MNIETVFNHCLTMKLKILIASLSLVVGISLAGLVARPAANPETQNRLYANAVRQTVLVETKRSQGSAFLFKRTNDKGQPRWFAWTAEHVVSKEHTVKLRVIHRTEARIVGETVYTAKVLRAVPGLDIALLFVDAPADAFLASEFADATPARLGDVVWTCGNFLGDDFPGSISVGVVSQVGVKPHPWLALDSTTAPVYPGSSGGPIFNKDGLVLGIVVARVDSTLGLFVPVRAIAEWASENDLAWAVRGTACPSDKAGGWLLPPPSEPASPPAPDSGCSG